MNAMCKLKLQANTFITHLSGRTLADDRYPVDKFRSTAEGDIRPVTAGETGKRKTRRVTASHRAVREMRPARDEPIVCKGLRVPGSGLQLWGEYLVWGRIPSRG